MILRQDDDVEAADGCKVHGQVSNVCIQVKLSNSLCVQ